MRCVARAVCLAAVAAITVVHPEAQRQLRYALFISGPDGEFDASGAVPAIELAEDYIRRNASVLDGYELIHSPMEDTLVGCSQCIGNSVPVIAWLLIPPVMIVLYSVLGPSL